jgi:hypothetical protein
MNDVMGVQADLEQLLDAWVEERGEQAAEELAETCGEVGPGGPVPSVDDVVRYNAGFGKTVDAEVLRRLATCRATLAIDPIRDSGVEHPLQVSILRFLVERLGASGGCLVDWGDHQIALGERVLDDLKSRRSRGRLGADAPEKARKPVRRRKERPGEVRSLRIFAAVERCAADPDLSIDLRRLLSASDLQARYLRLLENAGAMEDARAASELSVGADELAAALEDLDAKLRDLA